MRADNGDQVRDGLTMTPELMLDLARRTAELLVERIEGLPGETAWDGEFGMEAFRSAVDKGMRLAVRAEEHVSQSRTLKLMIPVSLGIVCFRINPVDADLAEEALEQTNRKVLSRIFWEDRAFLSSTLVHGTFTLRMCIINHTTTWDDVRETLEAAERFGMEASAPQAAPK